jgi:rSAM/selenodomain-associated transferase 1
MTAILYIAARAPRPGFAKTRLGKAIGHDAANALYAAFLQDLAARFATAPFPVGWYVTPDDAWESLSPLVRPSSPLSPSPASRRGGLVGPVLIQGPGDWGVRQQALFSEAADRGEAQTILVASDSPQLHVEVVGEAFALLEQHDLVLGPVDDGGYYLVGMRGSWPVLGGVPMSTRTVLSEIIARAEGLGLSVALVEPMFDVDEAEDLARLAALAATRDDLPATCEALATLGWLTPVISGVPLTPNPSPRGRGELLPLPLGEGWGEGRTSGGEIDG